MASSPAADLGLPAPSTSKQRRVSLALPASSPRVPWDFRDDTGIAGPSSPPQQRDTPSATEKTFKEPKKSRIRKIEPQDPAAPLPEKKPRKKWSPEETQMLVAGCNKHGVGNWKTILSDPTLKFDSRSPVDLKDRFRTYFPDAYKKHYPNARTHLSSKIRSTLPDGSSLFEKTRSKRRRPFTEEEDRALKAGYEKHGTVWATIVKDPVFQEQNRRSTDLRDRFRNAFPDLYQAAGYKPRNNTKKKSLIDEARLTGRAATDDQLPVSSSGTTGPVRGTRRRRAQTSQGLLLRGGTKSVPQSTAPSEDEDSSGPEDEGSKTSSFTKVNATPQVQVSVDQPSMTDGLSPTSGTGTPSSYFSPSSPFTPFNLTPLHTTHPLSPSITPAEQTATSATNNAAATASPNPNSLVGNLSTTLTTLNLPLSYMPNYYNSHQHHGVIERYDLWPPSSSALALSSSFSAMNNSSAWSSALSGSEGGLFSAPGSVSEFGSSFGGDLESEVSFGDTQSQTFSDDREHEDAVLDAGDGTYNMGYSTAVHYGSLPATRAITHHSDHAGDLIVNARGYGIGGGFGWFGSGYTPHGGVGGSANAMDDLHSHSASADGTTALGPVGLTTKDDKGIGNGRGVAVNDGVGEGNYDNDNVGAAVVGDGKGSINPMQLHAPSSGTDELALSGLSMSDSPDADMDEEMSDAGMGDQSDDAMDGSGASSPDQVGVEAKHVLMSGVTPYPEKQQQRQRQTHDGGQSNLGDDSPVKRLRNLNLSPHPHPHSPHLQHQAQPHHLHTIQTGHVQHHAQHNPHTPTHNGHSLSLSLGPSAAFSPPPMSQSTPGINTYGRFSLDDLDLVDLSQQQNALVDMNSLTPPATPVMQHATQLRGGRRYGMHGFGLNSSSGGFGGGAIGRGLFMQGIGQGQTDSQEQAQQAQATRSISVPPSKAKNANGTAFTSTNDVERGRPKVVDTMHTVKRSLSSTVHHSRGSGTHGHSSSLSTLPPLPSHSEIWRSSTPVAKTTSPASNSSANASAVSSSSSMPSTAGPNTTSALFSNLFSPTPSNGEEEGAGGGGGFTSTETNLHINPDTYTNSYLPFLDLHYNLGSHSNPHQPQQSNFGSMAMLVDTPATTSGISASSMSSAGASLNHNGAGGMTQAELEARQALDLAQPFHIHHTLGNGNAHAQTLQHLALALSHPQHQSQSQGSGYGFTNGANTNNGLKALHGSNLFNNPLSLARQLSQFSSAAASVRSQQQQQLGHQRVQSQQVVNPKDLVLNANDTSMNVVGSTDGSARSALRGDDKRKRASWDGGIL